MKKKLFYTEAESLEIVNFTNIGAEDFEGCWGKSREIIPAGKTVPLPMFKAMSFCKHLVDALLMKEGKDYGSDLMREPLEEKIMGRVKLSEAESEDLPGMEVPVAESGKEDEFPEVKKIEKPVKKSKKSK